MVKTVKKKIKKNVPSGKVYINATFNNTIVSVTDMQGNVICWSSAGLHGIKGSRKSTPYAAKLAVEDVIQKMNDVGMQQIEVLVKGPGNGRESALRAIASTENLRITYVEDRTPIPHNGCRPPKRTN